MAVKISVIMPVYNCERYLEAALQSVLTQSVQDLEIIAVDDGSVDASRDILRKYAEKDTRVRTFYNEKNLGVAAVRNLALEQVRGEYVAFCDSDDRVPEGAYEALLGVAEEKDIAVGTFDNVYYNSDRQISTEHCLLHPDADQSDFLAIYSVCCLWTKLIRASFIRENGLAFDESMNIGEDVVFLAEAVMRKPRVGITEHTVYYHCHHREHRSLTTLHTLDAYRQHIECRRKLLKLCGDLPECRDYVYLNFSRDVQQYLHYLTDPEEKAQAFELFRSYIRGYNYEQKPLLFKALMGIDYNDFLHMSAEQYFAALQGLEARERVAAEFDAGMIGIRWILRYLKGWARFKIKRSYQ